MTDAPPPDLAAANQLDPTLLARVRANAERLLAGARADLQPEDEPAHTYLADRQP